ncbi:hypothetical protein SAMN05216297_10193 [Flavobacterium phragmitis]|uniref:Uncharacterized protein n=1 Tax=Flavobacterium phragmitis TaxID=739143 RepID=A0A1I1JST3_9FLAO|nr:hypothetical protein SAMN05216297_10193 [Flavobacterium phragmitis]
MDYKNNLIIKIIISACSILFAGYLLYIILRHGNYNGNGRLLIWPIMTPIIVNFIVFKPDNLSTWPTSKRGTFVCMVTFIPLILTVVAMCLIGMLLG